MKKFTIALSIALLLALFSLSNTCYAGFNFGYDTYAQDGTTLITNSTGDQTSASTLGSLGTNDFIGELALKNELKLDGYSVAYDSNNPGMNPQYGSQYNVALPTGVDLTEISFAGKSGDPRTLQNAYVLTSEYDRLSAPGQADNIDTLNTNLSNETTNRINGDTILQNNINTVDTNSINRDNVLQTNINTVDNNSIYRDNVLQSNINNVNTVQTNWNQRQDAEISNINNTLDNHEQRIGNLEHEVSKLDATQMVVHSELVLQQGRREKIGVYSEYNFTRSKVSEVGISITIALDDSYEMKEIDKLNEKVARLNWLLEKQNIETETVKDGNKTIIRIKQKDGVIKMMNRF